MVQFVASTWKHANHQVRWLEMSYHVLGLRKKLGILDIPTPVYNRAPYTLQVGVLQWDK